MDLHGEELEITSSFYVWCAVGAAAGWLAGTLMGSRDKVKRIEEVLVGVFGAFIGGEGTAAMLQTGDGAPAFSAMAFAGGIGGAVVLLVLLRMMRAAVGPLRSGKGPAARRR